MFAAAAARFYATTRCSRLVASFLRGHADAAAVLAAATSTGRIPWPAWTHSNARMRLGLPVVHCQRQVRARYRKLALILHPDKLRVGGASAAFRAVSDAYREVLAGSKRCGGEGGGEGESEGLGLGPLGQG